MARGGKEMKAVVSIGGKVDASLNKSIQSAITSTKGMSAAMSASLGQAGNDIAKLDRAFNSIGKVGKAALSAVAVGAAGVTAGLAASIKVGASFESQMSTVEAISGASASEMQKLSDAALELGSTTQFTASEVGQAMEYMGMAGWKAEDMLAGVDSVINLAAASGEDLATVSDILTDDLTAFGMSAEEAGRMADVMAAASTNANTNVAMMGETFKYAAPIANTLGFSLEEVAVATGLMANNGIKASQAGTSLRSWMSRMAAPTKQTAQAMDDLGLSLTDDEGNMKSFTQIIEDTRTAMQGLSADEQTRYASVIAGKNAMSGMLAVINATEADTRKLTEAINDSAGAAEKMAEIRMDNLEGDVTKFKSAMEGLGVAIYDEVKEPAREVMQWITGKVDLLREKLPGMVADVVKKLPEFAQKVKKFLTPVFDTVKKGIQWVIDHKKGVIGVIAGIATAFVTYKIARKIADVVTGIKAVTAALGPLGIALGVIELAIGAVTAAVVTYQQYEQELINNNLAEHFGSISLSISEIQDVASALLDSNVLRKINAALEEFSKLDAIDEAIENAQSTIDKTNWKAGIGLYLSDEEKSNYQSAVRDYVKETNSYLEQEHYAGMLNLSTTFDTDTVEGNAITRKVNEFFRSQENEMTSLGQRLVGVVNQAFQDGYLDDVELDKIVELEKKIAEIKERIALGNQRANMARLSLQFPGVDLDEESAKNLQEELANQANTIKDAAFESLQTNLNMFEMTLSGSDLERAQESAWKTYLDTATKAEITSLDFMNKTVFDAYGEQMGEDFNKVKDALKAQLEAATADTAEHWTESWEVVKRGTQAFMQDYRPDSTQRKAVLEYLGLAEPTDAEIQKLIKQYTDAGQKVPETVVNSIMQFSAMELMHDGDYVLPQSVVDLFVNGMIDYSGDADFDTVGYSLTSEVVSAVEENSDKLKEAGKNATDDVVEGAKEEAEKKTLYLDIPTEINARVIGVNMNEVSAAMKSIDTLAGAKTSHEYSGRGSGGNYTYASGGFTHGPSIAGEEGTEAVISFDPSVRQRNVSIWKKAGEILGVTKNTGASGSTGSGKTISTGGNTINFNPVFNVAEGTKENVLAALRKAQSEFIDYLAEIGIVPEDAEMYAYGQ